MTKLFRKTATALAMIGTLLAIPAQAGGVADGTSIMLGRLTRNSMAVKQIVGVTNHTNRSIKLARIECGFFAKSDLLLADTGHVENVEPGQTSYANVIALDSEANPDRAECRVASITWVK